MTPANNPRRRGRSSPSGFTLIEILAVFLIIALLVGLLLPAIAGAVRAGKRATVTAEISSISSALANFKTKYGDYPPSRIYLSESGYFYIGDTTLVGTVMGAPTTSAVQDITVGQLAQRSLAALHRFFPQVTLSSSGAVWVPANAATGQAQWYDFNGNGIYDANPYILQGHECLVFFLGGIPLKVNTGTVAAPLYTYSVTGFGTNTKNPFTSSDASISTNYPLMFSANRQPPFYEFVPGRLILDPSNPTFPVNTDVNNNTTADGIPGYYDSLGNAPPDPSVISASIEKNQTTPPVPLLGNLYSSISRLNYIAYFSSSFLGGVYDPNDVNFFATEDDGYLAFGPNGAVSPGPNPYTIGKSVTATYTVSYQKPQSFQLISAGLDGLYGIGGQYAPPPAGSVLPVDAPNTTLNANPNGVVDPAGAGTLRYRERDNIANFGVASQLD